MFLYVHLFIFALSINFLEYFFKISRKDVCWPRYIMTDYIYGRPVVLYFWNILLFITVMGVTPILIPFFDLVDNLK